MLHIGQYRDVLRTLHWDVLRTSYFGILSTLVKNVLRTLGGDVFWRYIEGHMEMSIGHLLGKSSGRPPDKILPRGIYVKIKRIDPDAFSSYFLSFGKNHF